jgi:hypothetical protein
MVSNTVCYSLIDLTALFQRDIDMEDIDFKENVSSIWPQYRHVSDQGIQAFRFSLGFLGMSSGALIWLLLQGSGPWVITHLALVMSIYRSLLPESSSNLLQNSVTWSRYSQLRRQNRRESRSQKKRAQRNCGAASEAPHGQFMGRTQHLRCSDCSMGHCQYGLDRSWRRRGC